MTRMSRFTVASNFATHMKKLFQELEIPIVLVTHNHEDALFLAARLAVMIEGKIEQMGDAQEVFGKPKTPFIKRVLSPYGESN